MLLKLLSARRNRDAALAAAHGWLAERVERALLVAFPPSRAARVHDLLGSSASHSRTRYEYREMKTLGLGCAGLDTCLVRCRQIAVTHSPWCPGSLLAARTTSKPTEA